MNYKKKEVYYEISKKTSQNEEVPEMKGIKFTKKKKTPVRKCESASVVKRQPKH